MTMDSLPIPYMIKEDKSAKMNFFERLRKEEMFLVNKDSNQLKAPS